LDRSVQGKSFKDAVNSALDRTTGYVLTRETPAQREQASDGIKP
jgi:Arc/MetJ family transcription regulator